MVGMVIWGRVVSHWPFVRDSAVYHLEAEGQWNGEEHLLHCYVGGDYVMLQDSVVILGAQLAVFGSLECWRDFCHCSVVFRSVFCYWSGVLRCASLYSGVFCYWSVPSVLWHCWLGGRKGIQPVKNWVAGYWHGYLSGARCRLAYGPADATATHRLLLQ